MLRRLYKCQIKCNHVINDTPKNKQKNVQSDAGIDVHYITSAGASLEIQQKATSAKRTLFTNVPHIHTPFE